MRFGILRVACVGPRSAMAEARAAGASTRQALLHTVRAVATGPYRALDAYANVAGHAINASEAYARAQSASGWAGTLRTVFMPWTQWSKGWEAGWQSLVDQAAEGARIALAPEVERELPPAAQSPASH